MGQCQAARRGETETSTLGETPQDPRDTETMGLVCPSGSNVVAEKVSEDTHQRVGYL